MRAVEHFQYKVRDPRTGRWYRTRYKMSEADAAARHPERERLDHTREVRHVLDEGDTPGSPGLMQGLLKRQT
jgi:hypothetical protein